MTNNGATLMSMLQVQGREGHPVLYGSSWECCRRMIAAEGVTSLWRGSMSTYMKVSTWLAAAVLRCTKGKARHPDALSASLKLSPRLSAWQWSWTIYGSNTASSQSLC